MTEVKKSQMTATLGLLVVGGKMEIDEAVGEAVEDAVEDYNYYDDVRALGVKRTDLGYEIEAEPPKDIKLKHKHKRNTKNG